MKLIFNISNYDINDIIDLENIKVDYIICRKKSNDILGYLECNEENIPEIIKKNKYDVCEGYKYNLSKYYRVGEYIERDNDTDPQYRIRFAYDFGIRKFMQTFINYEKDEIEKIEKMLSYTEAKRNTKPTVYWIYGENSTSYVMENFNDVYSKDTYDWIGYDKHETVLIDKFYKDRFSMLELMKMFSSFPLRVETGQGLCRQLLSSNICITSISRPNYYFKNSIVKSELFKLIDHILVK